MNAPMTKAENIATSNVPALICTLRAEFDDWLAIVLIGF